MNEIALSTFKNYFRIKMYFNKIKIKSLLVILIYFTWSTCIFQLIKHEFFKFIVDIENPLNIHIWLKSFFDSPTVRSQSFQITTFFFITSHNHFFFDWFHTKILKTVKILFFEEKWKNSNVYVLSAATSMWCKLGVDINMCSLYKKSLNPGLFCQIGKTQAA